MSNILGMQIIGRDGCYVLHGLRVRAAAGCRERDGQPVQGSVWDEMECGVTTPLAGDRALADVLSSVSREHRTHVKNLPIACLKPML